MQPSYLVGLGGALGAVVRYLVGRYLDRGSFPYALLVVNTIGTFLLGLITFVAPASDVVLLVGVGLCGSFTTFSSFSYQTVQLWEQDRSGAAILHAVGNFCCCLLAVGLAWLLAGIA
jgi:CrcB protein